jgi:hypothetical protein
MFASRFERGPLRRHWVLDSKAAMVAMLEGAHSRARGVPTGASVLPTTMSLAKTALTLPIEDISEAPPLTTARLPLR